jgi:hypothetical protein
MVGTMIRTPSEACVLAISEIIVVFPEPQEDADI